MGRLITVKEFTTKTSLNNHACATWRLLGSGSPHPRPPAGGQKGSPLYLVLPQPVVAHSIPAGKSSSVLGRHTADTVSENCAGVASFSRVMSLRTVRMLNLGFLKTCREGPERQLRPWGIRGFLDHLSWRSVQDKRTHRSPDLRLARSTWLLSLKGLKGLPFAPSPAPACSPAAVPWPTQRGLCVPCQSSGPGCSRSVSPDQTLRPQPRRRFWGNQVVVKD